MNINKEYKILWKNLSKEQKLLIYCSRVNLDNEKKEKIMELLTEDLNWVFIKEKAVANNIASFLYYHLRGYDNIPIDVLECFENIYEKNLMRYILWFKELSRITDILLHDGINTVLLKGVSLSETIYSPGLRQFSDLDLLVPLDKLHKVEDMLIGSGYRLVSPDRLSWSVKNNLALSFINSDGVYLEIHTDIINNKWYKESVNIRMDEIWDNIRIGQIGDKKFFMLSTEDTVLHYSIHLSVNHGFYGLVWFCDINEFINFYYNKINWDVFFERVRRFNIKKAIYLSLFYTGIIFNNEICMKELDEIKNIKIPVFENKLWIKNILGNMKYADCWFFLMIDGIIKRLKVLFKIIFSKRETSIFKSILHSCNLIKIGVYSMLNILKQGVKKGCRSYRT